MAKLEGITRDTEAEDAAGGSFDLLPDGDYAAEVVESAYQETKKSQEAGTGDGFYIKLQWRVTEGKHAGRVLFDTLNVRNPNPKAAAIGKAQLRRLEQAMGLGPVDDSEELHGRPVLVRVKTRAASGGYDAQNEIKGYKPLTDAPSTGGGFSGSF